MRNIATTLVILVAVLAANSASATVVLFAEDFESLSDGSVAGQGGWTGDTGIRLTSSGNNLGTRVVDGFDVAGVDETIQRVSHSVDIGSAGSLVVLSFDTFAASATAPVSHGSSVGFNNVAWFPVTHSSVPDVPYWQFDARTITGNSGDLFEVPDLGFDAASSFEIVLNMDTSEVFGRYDFGSGNTGQTSTYNALPDQLAAIDAVVVRQDFRFVPAAPSASEFVGSEYDNIRVVAIPEAGAFTFFSFLTGAFALGAVVKRRLGIKLPLAA